MELALRHQPAGQPLGVGSSSCREGLSSCPCFCRRPSTHGTDRADHRSSLVCRTLAVDLLNPSHETEQSKHKLKRLVQSPNSFFMVSPLTSLIAEEQRRTRGADRRMDAGSWGWVAGRCVAGGKHASRRYARMSLATGGLVRRSDCDLCSWDEQWRLGECSSCIGGSFEGLSSRLAFMPSV